MSIPRACTRPLSTTWATWCTEQTTASSRPLPSLRVSRVGRCQARRSFVGLANLFADGLSMGVGNYLSIRARESALEQQRRPEEEARRSPCKDERHGDRHASRCPAARPLHRESNDSHSVGRFQEEVRAAISHGQRNNSASFSDGFIQPRVCRGRSLSTCATRFRCRWLWTDKSLPLGKY